MSVAQDICFTVPHGERVMPKHLLLPITVRHLTGCAELLTILNHFDHCHSYTKNFGVETPLCNSITESVPVLHPSVNHFCWDNFDLNAETQSGAGITYSTHSIVIQEVSNGTEQVALDIAPVPKGGQRTVHQIILN